VSWFCLAIFCGFFQRCEIFLKKVVCRIENLEWRDKGMTPLDLQDRRFTTSAAAVVDEAAPVTLLEEAEREVTNLEVSPLNAAAAAAADEVVVVEAFPATEAEREADLELGELGPVVQVTGSLLLEGVVAEEKIDSGGETTPRRPPGTFSVRSDEGKAASPQSSRDFSPEQQRAAANILGCAIANQAGELFADLEELMLCAALTTSNNNEGSAADNDAAAAVAPSPPRSS
jgi:hypothetical protein